MKFFDSIKSLISNLSRKRLPAANLIETEFIPIRFKGKYDRKLAELIRDEIIKHMDFYSVFLEKI